MNLHMEVDPMYQMAKTAIILGIGEHTYASERMEAGHR
jgi:hypothetical protein